MWCYLFDVLCCLCDIYCDIDELVQVVGQYEKMLDVVFVVNVFVVDEEVDFCVVDYVVGYELCGVDWWQCMDQWMYGDECELVYQYVQDY